MDISLLFLLRRLRDRGACSALDLPANRRGRLVIAERLELAVYDVRANLWTLTDAGRAALNLVERVQPPVS